MDELNHYEIQNLIEQLNPQIDFSKPQYYDKNWDRLKQERDLGYKTVVKTQTPKVYVHDKHFSFSYRAFDGASWTTEIRNIDVDKRLHGLTPGQHKLKDSLQTVFAITDTNIKLKWITPLTKDNAFDTTYQLLQMNDVWYCYIGDAFYKQSSVRVPPNKTHKEITFSTRNPPVFNQTIIDCILDDLI